MAGQELVSVKDGSEEEEEEEGRKKGEDVKNKKKYNIFI